MSYNGWKNRETWNVALWIGNDEHLYRCVVAFMKNAKGPAGYKDFIIACNLQDKKTPDGVQWMSTKLAYRELNVMIRELVED